MNKIQYKIQMFDKTNQQTFEHKFYISPQVKFTEVLKQFVGILEEYNLEINSSNLDAIIIGNSNPREEKILLERVK